MCNCLTSFYNSENGALIVEDNMLVLTVNDKEVITEI